MNFYNFNEMPVQRSLMKVMACDTFRCVEVVAENVVYKHVQTMSFNVLRNAIEKLKFYRGSGVFISAIMSGFVSRYFQKAENLKRKLERFYVLKVCG